MNNLKPSKTKLRELSKPFKTHPFDLLSRVRDTLIGMSINEDGPYKKINMLVEERPKLLDAYIDKEIDLTPPQLVTLENDVVYIVRRVQAVCPEWQGRVPYFVDGNGKKKPLWSANTRYAVSSTVCINSGSRDIPDDYDAVEHYFGENELDAILAAIKVVLMDRYDGYCDSQLAKSFEEDERLAKEYFDGKK